MNLESAIESAIARGLRNLGFELVSFAVGYSGKNKILNLSIEREDGKNVAVGDCSLASRSILSILEIEGFDRNEYSLEVSSPGLERPLKKFSDYEKFLGEDVKIKLTAPVNGTRSYKGKIKKASEGKIILSVGKEEISLDFDSIKKANLFLTEEKAKKLLKGK